MRKYTRQKARPRYPALDEERVLSPCAAKRMRICAAMLGVLTLLAGCAQQPPLPQPPVGRQPLLSAQAYSQQRMQALQAALAIDEVTGEERFVGETSFVILTSFRFDPDVLTLKSGTLTRVRLGNPSLTTHYFGGPDFFNYGAEIINLFGSTVPANQHHIPVAPNEVVDLYLFVKDPGEYRLDCFVPIHRDQGMVGAIIVE